MDLPRTDEAPPIDPARWFEQEVQPHDSNLKAYLRLSFPAVKDVDDVVQESYLRMWKARAAQPIQSAKAFLFQVARHVALDLIRKNGRSPFEPGRDSAASGVIDTSPDAFGTLIAKDTLQHLADAVITLPRRSREVIVLHKLQGLSQREVAVRLGLSERTVEKYCRRGLSRCQEYLRERGIQGFLG